LTFLNQNLNIQMPRVNDSILVLSPADVNEATQPIAAAAIGGGNNDNQGLVGRLVNTYVDSLKKERIMFAIFMGLWGIVVLMALCIIFWHSYGREWVEAHKKRRWQREQRGGLNGMSIGAPIPRISYDEDGYVHGHGNADEKGGDTDSQINLRSFTPLPEPKSGLNLYPFRRSTAPDPEPPRHSDEKSLDSFFDDGAKRPVVAPLKISKPTKLMAIGRKAMGRERLTGDEEDGTKGFEGDDDNEKQSFTWLKRMRGSLFNKSQPDYPPQEDHDANDHSLRSRLRPYLTISVENASGVKQGVTVEKSPRASPTIGPTSHWSTSPSHNRAAPWMKVAPPMPKFNPPGLPSRPQPPRNANVPTDVLSTYEDSSLLIPKHPPPAFKSTPLAVPLHHGFERPIPPWTPRSPSVSPFDSPIYETQQPMPATSNLTVPRDWHRRSSSVPAAAVKYAGHRDGSTPGTRTLVSMPARQSSNAVPVDPFVTPFDDDNRLMNHHTIHDNHGQGADSFEPVAM
jgi:hypothetical protein